MTHEQELFERHMRATYSGANLTKHPNGQYAWSVAQEKWVTWQAARRADAGVMVQTGLVDQG